MAGVPYGHQVEFMFESIRWSFISLTAAGVFSAVALSAPAVSAEPGCYKPGVCGMQKAKAEASPAVPLPPAPKRTEPPCTLKTSACLRLSMESTPPAPEHKASQEVPCTLKTAVCARLAQEKAASKK
jgi:hypothetical protein